MEKLPYYNPELSRSSYAEASNKVTEEILALLRDDRVTNLAQSGQLSVAIIRPHVGPDANLPGYDDIHTANIIEEQITGLGVLAKFSFQFTADVIETFYEGPSKENMKLSPPRETGIFDSTWSEFKNLMISGPSTVLLLHSPDDAITKWRDHLGHWNIEKTRDPNTIRGRLGVSNYNNLVHGSDSPESVLRELYLIANAIDNKLG